MVGVARRGGEGVRFGGPTESVPLPLGRSVDFQPPSCAPWAGRAARPRACGGPGLDAGGPRSSGSGVDSGARLPPARAAAGMAGRRGGAVRRPRAVRPAGASAARGAASFARAGEGLFFRSWSLFLASWWVYSALWKDLV